MFALSLSYIISYSLLASIPFFALIFSMNKKIKKLKLETEWKARKRTKELEKQKKLLETQKHEIRLQAKELRAITEKLQNSNNTLSYRNKEIEMAYQNASLLSEFGQRITASLNQTQIYGMVYEYVSSLTKGITGFGFGLFNEKLNMIEFYNLIENKKEHPPVSIGIDNTQSLATLCFKNKKEILINNFDKEWHQYISFPWRKNTSQPQSFIFLPLAFEDKPIGVIKIYAQNANAFTKTDVTNLRSLASYITIALENARVYRVVREQNRNIRKSINAAETIQKATLPMLDSLKVFDSFVLYRPKDIVSGDFYWHTSISPNEQYGYKQVNSSNIAKNEVHFIAAVDCTGHGIPGAFVSMIGNSLLNEIIKEKHIFDTAEILEELDSKIQTGLRQEQTGNDDGMDVCLCRIEKKCDQSYQLNFTGAKRPLIYTDTDNKVHLLKGDKKMIGRRVERRKQHFTSQTITLHKGASVFLTSDGYTDQNNVKRKRLGTPNFLQLLQENINRPMPEIAKELEYKFEDYKGPETQRDDVTVVGIRL